MTFTLVGNNQTVWGVWYDNYQPSGENNANAHLSISPAIYTGGAIALNAAVNGQLGLRYGNYITAFRFANIDYSTYLTIDQPYEIQSVVDDEDADGSHIGVIPVTNGTIDQIIEAVYRNREVDGNESQYSGEVATTGSNSTSVNELREMLNDKLADMEGTNQNLYILTGWLDNTRFGRNAEKGMDNDKGDVALTVTYVNSSNTNSEETYNERVYAHVYQQPVPANISASVYNKSAWSNSWGENSAFMRAEGSYATDSYFPNSDITNSNNIRNSNMRSGTKSFAAKAIFEYYNPTLYKGTVIYNPGDTTYFHNATDSILRQYYDFPSQKTSFNEAYRNRNVNADVVNSYEVTFNDDDLNDEFNGAAGPRANYYIDLSSPTTSNIANYIDIQKNQIEIPLYYSNILNSQSQYQVSTKEFNWYDDTHHRYLAGLFSADRYGANTNNVVGAEDIYEQDPNYAFSADFNDVEYMIDTLNGFYDPRQSYGANIWIRAGLDDIVNTTQTFIDADKADYNFFVRTKIETEGEVYSSHLRLVEDMEYGIYITDKSFLRTYYNSVMEDKFAQGYTYYSWENFRDATRLIADYLNNYMELADSVNTGAYSDSYDADVDYQYQINTLHYDQIVDNNYGGLLNVLSSRDNLDKLLSDDAVSGDVQGMLCYLLTAAEKQLFPYEEYQNFMDAYQEYQIMLQNRDDYTASSWRQYLVDGVLGSVEVNGKEYSFEALAQYTPGANDSNLDNIYDLTNATQEGVNTSWKIINDEYFGGDAKAVFVAATEKLNEAKNVLRLKADYTDLQAYMDDAAQYEGAENLASGTLAGSLEVANIDSTDQRNAGIFSIDRSTVSTLADSMYQGTEYVTDEAGNRYTISSMAAFDKVYDKVWEIKDDQLESSDYEGKTSDKDLKLTDRQLSENDTDANGYYSNLIRDDQPRYEKDAEFDKDSEVQVKIDDREIWMKNILDFLQNNQITDAVAEQYATFDYLIDVISSIDFNAYTPDGQTKLWNTLYDMLVKGGVYAVNQQLFLEPVTSSDGTSASIDKDSPLYNVLYGDNDQTYYTGWNTTDVDAATTELMELLSTLDTEQDPETGDWYKKHFNINVNVSIYNEDGTDYTKPSVTDTIEYAYGDTVEIDVDKYTEQAGLAPYDPSSMYIHSWSIDSASGTQYLHNAGKVLQFTASEEATVNVSVSLMPTPSDEVPENTVNVTVNSMIAHADRVDLAMNLSESEFSNYSISVAEDDTLTITGPDGFTQTFTPYKVSFYEFAGWRYNGLYDLFEVGQQYNLADYVKDGKVTISPYYKVQDLDLEITVNGDAIDGLEFRKFDSWVEFGADEFADMDGEFAAWLLKDTDANGKWDGTYTIASYDQEFSFYASDDEAYVQANKVTNDDGSIHYVVFGDETVYDAASQLRPVSDSEDAIDEIDTTSLYYRLSNGLRDAWSHISEYDTESETISLYSHYTSSETIPDNARVIETGGLFVYLSGEPSEAQLETFDDRLVVGTSGINQFIATQNSSSGQSEGQYVVSVVIPENRQGHGYYALMRNYVRYSYDLTDPTTGETETFYSYAYSDLQYAPVG